VLSRGASFRARLSFLCAKLKFDARTLLKFDARTLLKLDARAHLPGAVSTEIRRPR
jgi:hypothetical protein